MKSSVYLKLAHQGLGEEKGWLLCCWCLQQALEHTGTEFPFQGCLCSLLRPITPQADTWSTCNGSRLCVRSLTESHESLPVFGPANPPCLTFLFPREPLEFLAGAVTSPSSLCLMSSAANKMVCWILTLYLGTCSPCPAHSSSSVRDLCPRETGNEPKEQMMSPLVS